MLPQATRLQRRSHQQSSATEASAAPSNDTHAESHAAHGTRDPYGASKYVEAMRNPDWRRKDSNSHESDPPSSESLGFGIAAHMCSSSRNTGTEGSCEADDSDSCGSWDLIDLGQPQASGSHNREHHARGRPQTQASGDYRPGYVNQQIGTPSGYCQLVSPRELPNGWPMSLMEVRPISMQQAVAQSANTTLLRVGRAGDDTLTDLRTGPRNLMDEQSEQFAAALEAADRTPRKAKRSSQIPVLAHDPSHTRWASTMLGPHQAELPKDPAMNGVSGYKADKHSNSGPLPGTAHRLSPKDTNGPDVKFIKLLERLQRGSKDKSTSHEEPRQLHAPLPKIKSVTTAPGPAQVTDLKRDRRALRAMTNSSDSGYGGSDSQKLPNATFNPRAQEFLSFSGEEKASEDDDRHSEFQRAVPVKELFENRNETTQSPEDGGQRREPSSESDSLPSYDTHKMMFPTGGVVPFLGLPPQSIPGQPALGPNMFPNPGSAPPISMNGAPFANFAMAGSVPGGFWPGPGPMGMATTGPDPVPFQGWSANQGFNPMLGQPAPNNWQNSRPPPVSKPRKPDPSNQQAYEAWIEWRKANEPGYAMECKLRQQRRSQRNVAAGAKPKVDEPPKLETPTEVAASA